MTELIKAVCKECDHFFNYVQEVDVPAFFPGHETCPSCLHTSRMQATIAKTTGEPIPGTFWDEFKDAVVL